MPDLLAASPGARLVLPEAIVEHAVGLGLPADRLVGLDAGETFASGGFTVRAVPSAHEGLDTDDRGRHLYLGFVIEAEGLRLYHSGDSLAYDGLAGRLGPGPFDVLFLPINGRDPARGVPGNMSAAEAVDLAAAVRPRFVVPHHYDMFTFNTVPVARVRGRGPPAPRGRRAPGARGAASAGRSRGERHPGHRHRDVRAPRRSPSTSGATILASASAEYPCDHPRPGWSEQDPELWWEATADTVAPGPGQGERSSRPTSPAIGLSGQMHGSVFLDADGQVIRPALLWNDQRTAAECAEIEEQGRRPRGADPDGRQPRPDRVHRPQAPLGPQPRAAAWDRVRQVLLPKDYIRYRLTGTYATEVSDASGTLLLDVANRRWSQRAARQARPRPGAPAPVLREPRGLGEGQRAGGAATGLAAGTPVVGGGGDQPAGRGGQRDRPAGGRLGHDGDLGRRLRPRRRARLRPAGPAPARLPRGPGRLARHGRRARGRRQLPVVPQRAGQGRGRACPKRRGSIPTSS